MLDPSEKKLFLQKAESVIAETKLRIEELKELTKPIPPENAVGRLSRMDAINNKSINEAALRELEAKLVRMKSAVDKINDVYFGQCVGCGKSIPMGRLLLLPGSTKCVNCAS